MYIVNSTGSALSKSTLYRVIAFNYFIVENTTWSEEKGLYVIIERINQKQINSIVFLLSVFRSHGLVTEMRAAFNWKKFRVETDIQELVEMNKGDEAFFGRQL